MYIVQIFSNIFFHVISEFIGRYTVLIESRSSSKFVIFRFFYGLGLVLLSLYLLESVSLEESFYLVLLTCLVIVRLLIYKEQSSEPDLKWYSSSLVLHVPLSISLSGFTVLMLFYYAFDINVRLIITVLLVLNTIYAYKLYKRRSCIWSKSKVLMILLDLIIEIYPILSTDGNIPGVLVAECTEIFFYIIGGHYLGIVDNKIQLTEDKPSNFITYIFINSIDLLIDSYRSSSVIILMCSYASEGVVFWGVYLFEKWGILKSYNSKIIETRKHNHL